MQTFGIDDAFWLAAFLGETLLVFALFLRGEYRRFPIFVTWLMFLVIGDASVFFIHRFASTMAFYQATAITSVVDCILQFSVLVEIAVNVLRPGKRPGRLVPTLAIVLAFSFTAALWWTLKQGHTPETLFHISQRLRQIDFAFAFLRLGLFAAITGFSQMLGITWRNHVIRLAAGLAFYSAVSVIVQLTISHLPQGNHIMFENNYSLLGRTQVIAYLGALAFWVWSFAQKDVPRREFTPQMEQILVTISQAVRRNRVSLTRGLGHK